MTDKLTVETSGGQSNALDLNDTFHAMPWNEFISVVEGYGFKPISSERFAGSRGTLPMLYIAAHREYKLLLVATSYVRGDKAEELFLVRVYGTLSARVKRHPHDETYLPPLTFRVPYTGRYEITLDNSDNEIGLIYRLERARQRFKFVAWKNPNRNVWLPQYGEAIHRTEEEHRQAFLKSAPKWVRDFILPHN